MARLANVVLVPYGYLLAENIRKTLKIDWQNSIIIIDEAHNIIEEAEEAASCDFTIVELGILTMIISGFISGKIKKRRENVYFSKTEYALVRDICKKF